jgi:hypothetical protein
MITLIIGGVYLLGAVGCYKLYTEATLPEEIEVAEMNLPMAIIWPFSLPTILFACAWISIKEQINKIK